MIQVEWRDPGNDVHDSGVPLDCVRFVRLHARLTSEVKWGFW